MRLSQRNQYGAIALAGIAAMVLAGCVTLERDNVGVAAPPVGGAVTLPEGGAVTLPEGGAVTLPEGGAVTLPEGGAVTLPEGGAVTLRNGTALVVSLPPDPSTGYGWVLKSADPKLWEIGGPDATQDPKPPGLIGVAGATAYRFRAKAPGTSTIEFAWRAPPGQPAAPEKVVRYTVTALPPAWFGLM